MARFSVFEASQRAGFPILLLDFLLFFLRSFRVTAHGRSRIDRALVDGTGAELLLLLREAADLVLQPLDAARAPRPEDRSEAGSLWDRLERRTPEERLLLVEESREFQGWALLRESGGGERHPGGEPSTGGFGPGGAGAPHRHCGSRRE